MTLPKDLDNQIANDPELAFELLRLGVQNHLCECVPRALADGCDLNEMVVFARHNPDAEISFRYSLGARKFTGPQPLLAEIEEILAGPLPRGSSPSSCPRWSTAPRLRPRHPPHPDPSGSCSATHRISGTPSPSPARTPAHHTAPRTPGSGTTSAPRRGTPSRAARR